MVLFRDAVQRVIRLCKKWISTFSKVRLPQIDHVDP